MPALLIVIILIIGIPVIVVYFQFDSMRSEINRLRPIAKEVESFHNYKRELEYKKKQEDKRLADYFANKHKEVERQQAALDEKQQFLDASISNLSSIPYMAKIVADYQTLPIEYLARKLDWGNSMERAKKVATIREIRAQARELVEANQNAVYQLEYLKILYPALEDILDTDYRELPSVKFEDIQDHDRTRDFLSKEEWDSLSTTQKNQLALDRYVESHQKSKWQIGRDYELYVGYRYKQKGYSIDYYGSYMGVEDLGRDIIAKKGNQTLIIQCKYWSEKKTIHEKHIAQLYGTTMCYCMENGIPKENVSALLVTNIQVSDKAREFANYLNISIKEQLPMDVFPRIKCNIGKGDGGYSERIYHLPFDQQYDETKIDKPGEFFALTVQEAERAGFRRAFKWHGGN